MARAWGSVPDLLYGIRGSRNTSDEHHTIRVLSEFYPNKVLATRDIGSCHRTYAIVSSLLRGGYIERVADQNPGARYQMTLKGRCRILCQEFDIRLLCLCILCEAYCLHKSQIKHGCETFYVIHDIKDIFRGVYEHKTITNAANILHRRGLTRRRTRDTIEICGRAMRRLDAHQGTVYELHRWIAGIQVTLDRIALEGSDSLREIKNCAVGR